MSPSFALSFSLAFLFSVKTHGCGRRAEGRGGAWAQTQDIRRPGLSSYSFSLSVSPGPFCPCLSICVHAGMCLCLFAMPVWTLYRTAVLFSVGQHSQIWSTWGRAALKEASWCYRNVLLLRWWSFSKLKKLKVLSFPWSFEMRVYCSMKTHNNFVLKKKYFFNP